MKKRYMYLGACLCWMLVIFLFSSQVGDNSQSTSNEIIKMFEQFFQTSILKSQTVLFDTVSFLVRKAAHMSEYAILAMLFYLYLRTYQHSVKKSLYYAFIAMFAYACTDEFHQLFVVGREGSIRDVGIDTLGGSIGLLVQQGAFYIMRKWKTKH